VYSIETIKMITKAKTNKTRMTHLIKHALKTRGLGEYTDTTDISAKFGGENSQISFKIYGREYTVTYWITYLLPGTAIQYDYVVDDGVCWLNEATRAYRRQFE